MVLLMVFQQNNSVFNLSNGSVILITSFNFYYAFLKGRHNDEYCPRRKKYLL